MNKEEYKHNTKIFLDALQNDSFSVVLVDRTTEKKAIQYNIFNRTILSKSEILDANTQKKFSNFNYYHHDVYIKAEQGKYYNLIIDDLTKNKVNELVTALKINVNLVIFSSADNYQAVINIKKEDFTKEEADFLVKHLNSRYGGDENFSGANHYFRLINFNNKKKKNKNELVYLAYAKFLNDDEYLKNVEIFKAMLKDNNFKLKSKTKITSSTNSSEKFVGNIAREEVNKTIQAKLKKDFNREKALAKKLWSDKKFDPSIFDFRYAKSLFKQGFSIGQVATAFDLFIDYIDRHNDPEDYLKRTLLKAFDEVN